MIDIIKNTFATLQVEEIFHRREEISRRHDALIRISGELKLLVDFVPTYTGQIIFFRIEKEAFQQRTSVCNGWRITRAEATVNILQRLLFVIRRVLLQRLDQKIIVRSRDYFDFLRSQSKDFVHHNERQRLVGFGNNGLTVHDVAESHFSGQHCLVHIGRELKHLQLKELFNDVFVRWKTDRAKER